MSLLKKIWVKVSCVDEIVLHSWSSCLHLLSVGLATPGCHFCCCYFGVVLRTCVRLLNSLGSSLPHERFKGVIFYSAATCLFYTLVDFLTLVLKNIFQAIKLKLPDGANWLCDLLQISYHSASPSFLSNSGNSNTKLLNE